MLGAGVLGLVGLGVDQLQLHLQGRIAQQTGKLGLGDDLGGHQIQQHDLQGTDVLGLRPGLGHDENILFFQGLRCGEVIGDLNGHTLASLIVDFFTASAIFQCEKLDSLPEGLRVGKVHQKMAGGAAVLAVTVYGVIDVDIAGAEEAIQQTVVGADAVHIPQEQGLALGIENTLADDDALVGDVIVLVPPLEHGGHGAADPEPDREHMDQQEHEQKPVSPGHPQEVQIKDRPENGNGQQTQGLVGDVGALFGLALPDDILPRRQCRTGPHGLEAFFRIHSVTSR